MINLLLPLLAFSIVATFHATALKHSLLRQLRFPVWERAALVLLASASRKCRLTHSSALEYIATQCGDLLPFVFTGVLCFSVSDALEEALTIIYIQGEHQLFIKTASEEPVRWEGGGKEYST